MGGMVLFVQFVYLIFMVETRKTMENSVFLCFLFLSFLKQVQGGDTVACLILVTKRAFLGVIVFFFVLGSRMAVFILGPLRPFHIR